MILVTQSTGVHAQLNFEQAKAAVERSIQVDPIWRGPTTGPKAVSGKNIIFIASDLRNGGVNGVAKGMTEAIKHLDWNLRLNRLQVDDQQEIQRYLRLNFF